MGWRDDLRVLIGLRDRRAVAFYGAKPAARKPTQRGLGQVHGTGLGGAVSDRALGAGAPTASDFSQGVVRAPTAAGPIPFTGGRLTWDSQLQLLGNAPLILPPDDTNESWRMVNLDARAIAGMSATRLLHVLADMSPDVSRATWDFLRLCNPGWEWKALKPGTEEPHVAGQKALDAFSRQLQDRYGSVDVLHNRLFFAAYLRGAMMAELVLDERGRTPIDFATPDPSTARFQRQEDPVLGQWWLLGQYQGARFVPLDRPTIRYIPVDPAPGIPYGRPPAAPGIFSALFLLGLLSDLRRVIAQQGYPRLDLSLDLKALAEATPAMVKNDPIQWRALVSDTLREVGAAYAALQPDSAFLHTSTVTINGSKAAVSADALGPIDGVINALEGQLARGLKSMPILMGLTEGMSEANANRQWEIEAAGIKAIQHIGESVWSNLGTMALEAQGIDAEAKLEYAELRAAEMFRDAQTEAQIVDNEIRKYLQGWTSQDEGALTVTGHEADQDEPREQATTETPWMLGPEGVPVQAPAGGPSDGGGAPDNADVADSKDESADKGAASRRQPLAQRAVLRARFASERGLRWRRRPVRRASEIKAKGEPLASLPNDVHYDEGDKKAIARDFDDAVPAFAGILDAKPKAPAERRNGHAGAVK